jgi:hypothetical protein
LPGCPRSAFGLLREESLLRREAATVDRENQQAKKKEDSYAPREGSTHPARASVAEDKRLRAAFCVQWSIGYYYTQLSSSIIDLFFFAHRLGLVRGDRVRAAVARPRRARRHHEH